MTDQNPDREKLAQIIHDHTCDDIRYCSGKPGNRSFGCADAILASDWFAEVKRQERETAWEECYEYMTRNRPLIARQVPDPNPYRREAAPSSTSTA